MLVEQQESMPVFPTFTKGGLFYRPPTHSTRQSHVATYQNSKYLPCVLIQRLQQQKKTPITLFLLQFSLQTIVIVHFVVFGQLFSN